MGTRRWVAAGGKHEESAENRARGRLRRKRHIVRGIPRGAALSHKVVEEYGTTLEAREIYWRLHAPRGLMKLVPTSLRTPPRNVDDLAAYAILLRGAEADVVE